MEPLCMKVESEFIALEGAILAGEIDDYRQIDPAAFSWRGWDHISEERVFAMTLPFLRQQMRRGKSAMPGIYGDHYQRIEPDAIRSREDWHAVPVLMKDDDEETGARGFRKVANARPAVMKPLDASSATVPFGSGGSMGKYTPTFISLEDRAREIQGFSRPFRYWGMCRGDKALYTYNTTHKGGQWIQEVLLTLGADAVLKRTEEGPAEILQNMRDYDVSVLITVQQPIEAMRNQAKANGVNLHSLIETSLEYPEKYAGILIPDADGNRQVKLIFLGGFEIVPYAFELNEKYLGNVPIATILGSSEAIPQAFSSNPALAPQGKCHYNNLHLLQGPHYIEVVKKNGDKWIPVAKGEEGLLVYTSWARDGTIWIRYAPGDVATWLLDEGECPCGIRSPVITNVRRKDAGERSALLVNGCAAG